MDYKTKTYLFTASPKPPYDHVKCTIEMKVPEEGAVRKFGCYGQTYVLGEDGIERCKFEDVIDKYVIEPFDAVKACRIWPSDLRQRAYIQDIEHAFSRLDDTDTYENLAKYIFEYYDYRVSYAYGSQDNWRYSDDPFDRYIGKIGKFKFDREVGNTNRNTFDFIRCDVSIMAVDDHYDFCKKNYKTIVTKVLHKLETNKQFLRYGVPINVLRVSNATVLKDGDLALLFELKKEVMDGRI